MLLLDPPRRTYDQDSTLRKQLFPARDHGGKANLHLVLDLVERYSAPGDLVLDPMAGVGSLLIGLTVGRRIVLNELEPRHAQDCAWNAAAMLERCSGGVAMVLRADAWHLPLRSGSVDGVIFSPPYGDLAKRKRGNDPNTLANPNVPEWKRKRRDSALHVDAYGKAGGQIGNMNYPRYLMAMAQVYVECRRVVKPGGRLVVITGDLWRGGKRVQLGRDTRDMLRCAGFELVEHWLRDRSNRLLTWQHLRRKQGLPVIDYEDVQVFV